MHLFNVHTVICFCAIIVCCKTRSLKPVKDTTQPLILTPLIKSGNIKEAQEAAEVKFDGFKGIRSYSGYFTVNEQYNSNLFFWFFPSEINYESAPVVLWLQGGPGASSLIGLFVEIGPFYVKNKHGLKRRPHYWSQTHSVIYIDSPVGSGYSFTDKEGLAQNQTLIGQHLYSALLQFFQLFPELQKNAFFVTGESYAGKYVPVLSYEIMKQNPSAKQKINLEGLAIGNGLCDPENQLGYAEYLYQIGLIDIATKSIVQTMVDEGIKKIHKQQWEEASDDLHKIIIGSDNEFSLFKNVTGFSNYFNILYLNDTTTDNMEKYVIRSDVKAAIHVGNTAFSDGNEVLRAMKSDFAKSVAPLFTELLDNYKVLLYNGQLDVIIAYPLTVNFIQKLKFSGSEEYKTAKRHQWIIDGDVAGYVKQAGNLTEILVRNSGHFVPTDQPVWALDMLTRFTGGKPFY
ncbi:hypothetical protein RN001_011950 [Aquatica leii]|uniref:Carboxypeptidase n=1 Tax=Aquatica leii TaxID=1421715 RepID=A0AAN7P4X4_9COLE|nr:hypothetical protein RN001_011950 [Aquatica leii]